MIVYPEKIEEYLKEVREAIDKGKCRIEQNKNREDNVELFFEYGLSEADAYNIIKKLSADDFSEIVIDETERHGTEYLYVFGKDTSLKSRLTGKDENVSLYIKFNKMKDNLVIVVSFHRQKYPMKYYYK